MLRSRMHMKALVRVCDAAMVLVAVCSLLPLAHAADNIDDLFPAEEALKNCGQNYVRDSALPTISGAQARCAAEFERLMKTQAIMVRLTEPRIDGPTPEWESRVAKAVAEKRALMRDDFSKSVKYWIAESQH